MVPCLHYGWSEKRAVNLMKEDYSLMKEGDAAESPEQNQSRFRASWTLRRGKRGYENRIELEFENNQNSFHTLHKEGKYQRWSSNRWPKFCIVTMRVFFIVKNTKLSAKALHHRGRSHSWNLAQYRNKMSQSTWTNLTRKTVNRIRRGITLIIGRTLATNTSTT